VTVSPPAVLLDTHGLIWWATDARRLGRAARRIISADEAAVFVSAATAWEIATKVKLGKLSWPATKSVEAYCLEQRFELLAVTFAHAERAGSWPQDHGDPFDRLLAAQSAIEGLPLLSNDPQITQFGITLIW
jgi:PIN domain nuclease of toxin-antitoxin system